MADYKILHVEHVAADAERVSSALNANGMGCDISVVESQVEYERALDSASYDVVLCAHQVPGLKSYKALCILKQRQLNIPFIIVTSTMTEDIALAMVREGADDYILKDRLKRLPHAVVNSVEKFRHETECLTQVNSFSERDNISKDLLTKFSNKMLSATKVAGIGIWEFSFEQKKLTTDEVLLSQFQTTVADFDGNFLTLLDFVVPQDRAMLVKTIKTRVMSRTEFNVGYRILWPDNSLHYMKTVGIVELNSNGDPYRIIGSNQDITADKLAERKLKESEARMSQAQQMAKIGSWQTDLATMEVVWSAETCRIFEIDNCKEQTTHENFLKFVHPDDKRFVDETFINSIGKKEDSSLEHRIVTESGRIKYVEECWRFEYSADNRPLRAIGTIQDITASKEASLLVFESEAKYRSLIESSMDAILLTKKTGEILAANSAASIFFRMSEQEILDSRRGEIVKTEDPRFLELFAERERTGRAKGELNFIRKDKSIFAGEISSVVFTNADGEERVSNTIRDISSRKIAEKKLLQTSEELKNALEGINKIMDSSVDIICAVSGDGKFMKVSAACERIWGYKPAELIGESLINFVHPEDRAATLKTAERVMGGDTITHFENRYIRKDGSSVPMEWTARWDANEQIRYGVARDVTEKKKLETAIDLQRRRFEDLYLQAPSCMVILKGPEYVYEIANPLYLQLIGRSDIIGKKLKDVLPELSVQGKFEMLDEVYKTGKPYVGKEVPVHLNINGNGVLVEKYLNFIYQAHRNINNEIDGIFFFAVEVTEQVISRKTIHESEKKFKEIVELAQEGIWVINEHDVTTFVNGKMAEILGYPVDEIMGKEIFFFMDNEGEALAKELLKDKENVGNQQFSYKFFSKSGKEVWTSISSNPLIDKGGKYIGAMAMLTDITEVKQAQELLSRSEYRYRTLFEQNLAGFYQSTLDGVIINCNYAFAKMLKYDSPEDVMSVNASALYFTEDDRKHFITNVVENKNLYNYEGISKCKDGTPLYFLENVSVHTNPESGIEYFDGIMIDISEKKEAELRLRESNERFFNVGKATFDIIWDWNIDAGTLYLGDRFDEVFGYATENKIVSLETWSDHIHPEDKERVLDSLIRKTVAPDSKTWISEYRYLSADGRVCHIADRGILLTNENGQRHMVGAMQDVTEKKALENLLSKASTLAAIGSWEIDLVKQNVYWSDIVRDIFEAESDFEPTFDSALNLIYNEQDKAEFFEAIKEATATGRTWDVERRINTISGNKKWIRIIAEAEYVGEKLTKVYGSLQDIDQRKISELAITKAFNEKNTILESIGDAFFAVDHDWKITYWNNQAEIILHKTKAETIGNNLWTVFAESIDSYSYKKYQEAISKHTVIQFEDHYPALNKWYEISAYPSDTGLSVYFKDITGRKQTDEAVRASEEVRKLIMDAAMDAIICINATGAITVWNPQAEKIFGWSEQELMGKILSDIIIPERLRDGHIRGMSRYLETGHGPLLGKAFETTAVNRAGNEFPIELSVVPIKQGKTEFFCAFIRDISRSKESEKKMADLHQNLLEQSKKLMVSNEELEKYAYVTSHDLQEPLRMVTSFLQLLQKKYEGQLDDTAQKYINFAVDGAGRMKTLILDLLEFSRISSAEHLHQAVSLKDVVSKTLMALKTSIDETETMIYVPDLPIVFGNELQLTQLFQNLISNAIKYKGSDKPVIEISCDQDDLYWKFSVKDNGIGIEPQFFEKVFVIFQRLHNKKNYLGTGIGLAICKKIVELHDGKIWVESQGKGSTFNFILSKQLPEKKIGANQS